jgi:hypothetical protein
MADATTENQEKIIANQQTMMENQKTILANQQTMMENQKKLDQILANQNAILGKVGK